MPQEPTPAQLQKKLAGLFDPETDDKPDALGPEDVDDDGEVIRP